MQLHIHQYKADPTIKGSIMTTVIDSPDTNVNGPMLKLNTHSADCMYENNKMTKLGFS